MMVFCCSVVCTDYSVVLRSSCLIQPYLIVDAYLIMPYRDKSHDKHMDYVSSHPASRQPPPRPSRLAPWGPGCLGYYIVCRYANTVN